MTLQVYPPNFPETADYVFAHAGALIEVTVEAKAKASAMAAARGNTAGRSSKATGGGGGGGFDVKELLSELRRCFEMRTICFGPDSPATKEVSELLQKYGDEK